jgi:hypothetical protein
VSGALFALVNRECNQIFAWGLEISIENDESDGPRKSAVIYRPGNDTEQHLLSTHASAEAARNAYARVLPVNLEWDDDH